LGFDTQLTANNLANKHSGPKLVIREGVLLEKDRGLERQTLLELEVISYLAELLFDLCDGFEVGGEIEVVAAELKEPD